MSGLKNFYFGAVSWIRIRDPVCLFDPWIRDSGWVKNKDPDPGWVKNQDPDPG
jgi:hypothetical protein